MALLLVNPLSSGRYLSDSFRDLGIRAVAIYTVDMDSVPRGVRPSPGLFDEEFYVPSDDVEEILVALRGRSFDMVLSCSEATVDISDRVAQALAPDVANDPGTSGSRMDKALMAQAVERAGLPHIRQRLIDLRTFDVAEVADDGMPWPRFVRPLRGAASVGAMAVASPGELAAYLRHPEVVDALGGMGAGAAAGSDGDFLLSEFVEGTEYFVDTFSLRGMHFFSSIQRYSKSRADGRPMMRYFEVETDKGIASRIADYVRAVLDSIQLCNGFTHTEVFLREDGEVVLIEVNARVSGGSGVGNQVATLDGLPSQPALLQAVLYGGRDDITYVPPTLARARALWLFHYSESPLPDLTSRLADVPAVRDVLHLRPPGWIRAEPPESIVDLVALVILYSEDSGELHEVSEYILEQDRRGWP